MVQNEKIYGIRAIIEAIEADQTIDKVFLQQALDGPLLKQLKFLIKEKGIFVV